MKVVLALFLGLSLYALPAKADEFADVSLVTILGNSTAAEAFSLSVVFDNTTQTIIPDGVQTLTFGALGAFNFAGFTVAPTSFGSNNYSFAWKDLGGDTMTLLTVDESSVQPGHWGKADSLTGPNVAGWGYLSVNALSGGFFDPPGDPGDPPSPTPEPSSLILLGIGLVSAVFMSRKLITS
jgi:PEP-CTERM motif